jgi:autotransporter-associated beta strand protein
MFYFNRTPSVVLLLASLTGGSFLLSPVFGEEINSYNAAVNARFTDSAWATDPISNASTSFLGYGYDLSGVGWDVADDTENMALLNPGFLYTDEHEPVLPAGAATAGFDFQNQSGQLVSVVAKSNSDLALRSSPYNLASNAVDVSVTPLAAPIAPSQGITYYSILDVGPVSNYVGLPLLMYGHQPTTAISGVTFTGPVLGTDTVSAVYTYGTSGFNGLYHYGTSTPTSGTIETGDSSSPGFIPFVNPVTGEKELTIIGGNYTSSGYSFLADPSIYPLVNAFMAKTGYSLHWTPSSIQTSWQGGASGNWTNSANWTSGVPTSSGYIVFDAANAGGQTTISLGGSDQSVVGINFKSTTGGKGFTFAAGNTLTVGRGGIVNFDSNVQTFNGALTATDALNLEGGTGGFVFNGTIANGGNLVYLESSANSQMNGVISGIGGLSKAGTGMLSLTAANSFTGGLFVHAGTVLLQNSGVLPTNENVYLDGGVLDLNGLATTISLLNGTGGDVALGNGTLTIAPASSSLGTGLYSGTISGDGRVVKAGAGFQIFSGANTYTGGTSLSASRFYVMNTTGSALGTGAVAVTSGGALFGTGSVSGAVTVSGPASGLGAGILSPFTPSSTFGTLTLGSSLTLLPGARYSTALGRSTGGFSLAGDASGKLNVGGGVSLAGAELDFSLEAGYTPVVGDVLYLILNGSDTPVTGVFSKLNGTTMPLTEDSLFTFNNDQMEITYLADAAANSFTGGNDVALQVVAVPEPGIPGLLVIGGLSAFLLSSKFRPRTVTLFTNITILVTLLGRHLVNMDQDENRQNRLVVGNPPYGESQG